MRNAEGTLHVDIDDHQPPHKYPDQTLACGYICGYVSGYMTKKINDAV